jgi:hypothetical protein
LLSIIGVVWPFPREHVPGCDIPVHPTQRLDVDAQLGVDEASLLGMTTWPLLDLGLELRTKITR